MPPPFRHPRDRWLARSVAGCGARGDRGVDVGPGGAPGALEGVVPPRHPRRRHRGRRAPPAGPGPAAPSGRCPTTVAAVTGAHRRAPRQRPDVRPRAARGRWRSCPGSPRPTRSSSASRPRCSARPGSAPRARRCSRSRPRRSRSSPGRWSTDGCPIPAAPTRSSSTRTSATGSVSTSDRRWCSARRSRPTRRSRRSSSPPDGATSFRERMTVVGIAKSVSSDLAWTPSSGFYAKYGTHMPDLVNEFVDLRDGRAGIPAFNRRVERDLRPPGERRDRPSSSTASARR